MQPLIIVPTVEKRRVVVIAANRVYANVIFLKSRTHLAVGNVHRFWAPETRSKVADNQDIGARYPAIHCITDKSGHFAVNVPANPKLPASTHITPSSSPRFSPSFPCPRGGSRQSSASWPRASHQRCAWNRRPCTKCCCSAKTTERVLPRCVCCRR